MKKWFESEIDRANEYLKEDYCTVFNGVDVKSNELRKELLEAHIKFCKAAMINARAEDEQTAKMRSQIESLKAENESLQLRIRNIAKEAEVEKYEQIYKTEKKKQDYDCQIAEYKGKTERLQNIVDELDSALYTTFGIRHTDFKNHLELADALEAKMKKSKPSTSIPEQTKATNFDNITTMAAGKFIRDRLEYWRALCGEPSGFTIALNEIKEFAEHLLVYCNHAEIEGE